MTPTPHDPEGVRRALAAALGVSRDECGTDRIHAAYEHVLLLCWERMALIVGQMGARAIVEHSIERASRSLAAVAGISVSDSGPDLDAIKATLYEGDRKEFCLCLQELCVTVLVTLGELTGDVVTKPLLAEIARQRESWHDVR